MRAVSAAVVDIEVALARHRFKTSRGTVAQAAFDEDAVTLAARCGLALLQRNPGTRPSALVVASLSAPLFEPGLAPFLIELFDLQASGENPATQAFELGGTVSAGVGAVSLATMQVWLDSGPVMVVASDDRRDTKGRPLGAGAVALLIAESGNVGGIEVIEGSNELFLDRWQDRGGSGVRTGDRSLDRFSPGQAFVARLGDVRVLYSHASGPTIDRAGFPGTASPLLALLTSGIEPGEGIMVASSAGGITRSVKFTAGSGFPAAAKRAIDETQGGLEGGPPEEPDESVFDPYMSQPTAYRERAQTYRLEAARDPASGEVIFPAPPAPSRAGLEVFHLGRTGKVVTFARDHVYPLGSPLTMAAVDLDGGGRFFGQVVDGLHVDIGDSVELVLRRLHQGGGVPNYFWKIQPQEKRQD